MRRIFILLTAVAALSLNGCWFFREPPPPPVTDSQYFNEKITSLGDSLINGATRRPRKVVILDFVNTNGKTSQLGKYLTAKFLEISVQNNWYLTPPEGEVSKTLKQLNLTYNGSMDAASATRLGAAMAADALIVGVISDLQKGSDVDLVVKMIDAKTGTVISAASASFIRSKQVSGMMESF